MFYRRAPRTCDETVTNNSSVVSSIDSVVNTLVVVLSLLLVAVAVVAQDHTVILDPKSGDTGSVSPGVGKGLRTVQRERDDLTTSARLAIDPRTARKSRKRLGKN